MNMVTKKSTAKKPDPKKTTDPVVEVEKDEDTNTGAQQGGGAGEGFENETTDLSETETKKSKTTELVGEKGTGTLDADVQAATAEVQMPSGEKVKKAKEVVKVKQALDPLVAEPSSYQGIPLTAEEAAAHDPAKFILAQQLSKDETEAEEEVDDEPVKGHITTDEERLSLILKQPETLVGKVKPGRQAPLQFANHKADNASERRERVARQTADAVASAVRGKV